VKNIFSSLITGSELILGPEYLFDFEAILGIIMKHNVTLMNCVPSLFYELMDINKNNNFNILKNIKLVILGGEAIERRKIMDWAKYQVFDTEIMNVYGPTECTSVSTFSFLKKNELLHDKSITIGNPTYNKQVYVLKNDGRICPIYAKGELCISGIGTINSYIGEFNQTSDVFSKDLLDPKLTLYHTGDIVYWNQDGELIFVGRKDKQVKIDGHRIELGEIEQALLKRYTEIKQCCVLLQEENHHKVLVAHVIMNQDAEQLVQIEENLLNWLPSYMIPKNIVYHNTFPLTPHGKIDYKKIIENSSSCEKIETVNENENLSIKEQVANIWRTLLSENEIDYDANFFDAGGYSLLLYKLSKMIEVKLNCKVTFVELMTYTTINTFSEYMEVKMKANSTDPKQFAKLKLQEMKNRRTRSW
jgi:acyl-coenzyme A synthetase/AMP-(fatty) acid ligase/aryl carrier-like protein